MNQSNEYLGVLFQATKINDKEIAVFFKKKYIFFSGKGDRGEWSLDQICLGTGRTPADTWERRMHIGSICRRAPGSSHKWRALLCGKYEACIKIQGMQAPPIRMQMDPEGFHADF